jgi:hypothetical protein
MGKLLVAAVLVAFTMVSCRKDYTCACKYNDTTVNVMIIKAKKKDAEGTCKAAEATYKQQDPEAKCTM